MSNIIFFIVYSGLQLPVIKNEAGQDVTPLKPIAELFGLSWTDQHKKVTKNSRIAQLFGSCKVSLNATQSQRREYLCIPVGRVSSYLMGLNERCMRSQGNIDGATFLIEKQLEWAAAFHMYEEQRLAFDTRRIVDT